MLSHQSPLPMLQVAIPAEVVEDSQVSLTKNSRNSSKNTVPQTPNDPNNFHQKKWLNLLIIGFAIILVFVAMWVIATTAKALPNANISITQGSLSEQQRQQLQRALGDTAQGNFYQANLQDYQARAQALPWVSQVDIKRDWQKGLIVTAVPRQPVAKFGSEKLIDASGKVFEPADNEQLNSQKWMQLQSEPEKSALIMQQTEQVTKWFHPLNMNIEEVILTPRMTWLFRFSNGLRVIVDKESTSEKLYQLSILLQNQLKDKITKIETVDLRYKNGLVLTWKQSTPTVTNNDVTEQKAELKPNNATKTVVKSKTT